MLSFVVKLVNALYDVQPGLNEINTLKDLYNDFWIQVLTTINETNADIHTQCVQPFRNKM